MIYQVDFIIHPIGALIIAYSFGVMLGWIFGYGYKSSRGTKDD